MKLLVGRQKVLPARGQKILPIKGRDAIFIGSSSRSAYHGHKMQLLLGVPHYNSLYVALGRGVGS